ncbi:D-2-hydroxyacid dehydrogenase [Moorella sulfitireducens (nom. illeg.)]|uniref:D-2-hydroxyacid dehydrogenase n=1 Tax=Neomoorella sulfitireducens TaxID=2972948 RepID=UPI0021AC495F|nr:D-2-hydroxyacid dehydrogenase [Moorella sulfitireducens]
MKVNSIAILYKPDDRVPHQIEERHLDMVRNTAPQAEVIYARDEQELLAKVDDADVLLTWGLYKPVTFCQKAKSLKWLHALSAGLDGVMTPEIRNLKIRITSTKNIHGLPMGNHVLAYILSFLRCLPVFRKQQELQIWDKEMKRAHEFYGRYFRLEEAWGKTVGIVGFGSIGREIARQCKALNMRVVALKRTPVECELLDRLYSPDELELLLRESDFVVIIVPLTAATRGMIDEKKLKCMKRSAFLINVARGPVVDEAALIKALEEGTIAGAGLDVFEIEPLPADSPLWKMPNVIITPHCAADSPMYMDRAFKVFCDNLKRFLNDEPLLYEADLHAGY